MEPLGQDERVTDVTTDKLGFGQGDPEHILRPTPSPPLWFCRFKPTAEMWIRRWRKCTGVGVRGPASSSASASNSLGEIEAQFTHLSRGNGVCDRPGSHHRMLPETALHSLSLSPRPAMRLPGPCLGPADRGQGQPAPAPLAPWALSSTGTADERGQARPVTSPDQSLHFTSQLSTSTTKLGATTSCGGGGMRPLLRSLALGALPV